MTTNAKIEIGKSEDECTAASQFCHTVKFTKNLGNRPET